MTLPSNVVPTYGLTESGSGVVYDGVPLDGVEVTVRQGDGTFSGPGAEGGAGAGAGADPAQERRDPAARPHAVPLLSRRIHRPGSRTGRRRVVVRHW